jgi:hypothetical protein
MDPPPQSDSTELAEVLRRDRQRIYANRRPKNLTQSRKGTDLKRFSPAAGGSTLHVARPICHLSFVIRFASRLLAIGYWLLAIGYWLLAIGYWLLAIGYFAKRVIGYCEANRLRGGA